MHSWVNICKSDQTPLTAMSPVMMRTTKLEYEQHLAQLFNDTIPDLKLTAGFGILPVDTGWEGIMRRNSGTGWLPG